MCLESEKGTPSPPGPCLPFLPHSVIHQSTGTLPHAYLLHCLLPFTTCPRGDPTTTASSLAPGSPAGRTLSHAYPIILLGLEPSVAPLLLGTTWWSGSASSVNLIPSQPGPLPSAVGAAGSAPNLSSVCHHCAFAQADPPPPCSHSLPLPPGDSAQGLLPPGSHLFHLGGIRGLSCTPTDPRASVGHGHCLSLHNCIAGAQ